MTLLGRTNKDADHLSHAHLTHGLWPFPASALPSTRFDHVGRSCLRSHPHQAVEVQAASALTGDQEPPSSRAYAGEQSVVFGRVATTGMPRPSSMASNPRDPTRRPRMSRSTRPYLFRTAATARALANTCTWDVTGLRGLLATATGHNRIACPWRESNPARAIRRGPPSSFMALTGWYSSRGPSQPRRRGMPWLR